MSLQSVLRIFVVSAVFFVFIFAKQFATFDTTFINGHKYYGRSEQPFFRVKHKKHFPIEAARVNESDFFKHGIGDDEEFVPHNWTNRERDYLKCVDLICVCPFFNGTVRSGACILPNGMKLKPAIRKELRMLTDEERQLIANAIRAMHSEGLYNRFGRVHKHGGVHSGPGFFPWHREYLKRFEFLLRTYLPMGSTLGVPYWDSTLDEYLPNSSHSIFFSKYLTGDTDDEHYITYGPYANLSTMEGAKSAKRAPGNNSAGELFSDARIDVVLDQKSIVGVLSHTRPLDTCSLLKMFQLDERFFEYSHDYVHYYVGGDFEDTFLSTNDNIFWWHHTFVDFIWEMWRQKVQTREERETEYPPSDPNCYPAHHFKDADMSELDGLKMIDGLSNGYTDNCYHYDERPRCSNAKPECGSDFLFCDTVNFERPKCQSKIKLGGDCSGYEDFDICYEGTCRRGVCSFDSTALEMIWSFIKRLFGL